MHHFLRGNRHVFVCFPNIFIKVEVEVTFDIFQVVVYQLGIDTSETVKRQLKAAKALLAIMPLLGTTFVITMGMTKIVHEHTIGWVIFVHARAFLLSAQGFLITLPYCFLNTEVRTILRQRWDRRRASRRREFAFTKVWSQAKSYSDFFQFFRNSWRS